jgi:hypothetical protein
MQVLSTDESPKNEFIEDTALFITCKDMQKKCIFPYLFKEIMALKSFMKIKEKK